MDELHLKLKSEDWLAAFLDEKNEEKQTQLIEEYISQLNLDGQLKRREVANAIADIAIGKIYDNTPGAQNLTAESYLAEKKRLKEQQEAGNPFSGMDYKSPQFAELIEELCQTLKIAPYPDPQVRLKAACLFIQENLKKEVIEQRNATHKTKKTFDLNSIPLGYPSQKDKSLDVVARILRILNVASLRNTQTIINETLVAIQNITIDQTKKPDLKQVTYGKS
ncbi:unnamed protein product [Auanema sp. JU1783]|nr:unnamed protein product [Auanema sp. JU1783]